MGHSSSVAQWQPNFGTLRDAVLSVETREHFGGFAGAEIGYDQSSSIRFLQAAFGLIEATQVFECHTYKRPHFTINFNIYTQNVSESAVPVVAQTLDSSSGHSVGHSSYSVEFVLALL